MSGVACQANVRRMSGTRENAMERPLAATHAAGGALLAPRRTATLRRRVDLWTPGPLDLWGGGRQRGHTAGGRRHFGRDPSSMDLCFLSFFGPFLAAFFFVFFWSRLPHGLWYSCLHPRVMTSCLALIGSRQMAHAGSLSASALVTVTVGVGVGVTVTVGVGLGFGSGSGLGLGLGSGPESGSGLGRPLPALPPAGQLVEHLGVLLALGLQR